MADKFLNYPLGYWMKKSGERRKTKKQIMEKFEDMDDFVFEKPLSYWKDLEEKLEGPLEPENSNKHAHKKPKMSFGARRANKSRRAFGSHKKTRRSKRRSHKRHIVHNFDKLMDEYVAEHPRLYWETLERNFEPRRTGPKSFKKMKGLMFGARRSFYDPETGMTVQMYKKSKKPKRARRLRSSRTRKISKKNVIYM
jgi:hypothetical protein